MAGLFISFEGVDGVGKTTQVGRLRDYALSLGYDVVVTREPGGTPLGRALRQLLLHGVSSGADDDAAAAPQPASAADIAPRAEALIFAADRAQHVAEKIRPALERGAVVITDRYERTYLLDMDPSQSHERLTHSADRMEAAGDDFQKRTRRAFLDLAQVEPERFLVVDAARSVEEVWRTIRADVDAVLARRTVSSSDMGRTPGDACTGVAGGAR